MKSGLTSVSRKSEIKPRKSSKEKKKQLNLTNQWLEENYCVCEGVCIPRCILYAHYLEFCQMHGISPSCAATFGKVIRQKFPNITTRRLGTRGHSKYHYYGICIKENRQYYQSLYSSTGLTRFSGSKFINEGGFTRKYNLASKVGCTLPSFPNSYTLALPPTVDCSKLDVLLKLYRTHCQSILDVVVSSLFLEVPNYLSHFWQSLPSHLRSLLEEETVSTLLVYCDSILHHSLIDLLIPSTMQEVSEDLLVEVQHLANGWETWLGHSMASLPLTLVTRKANAAQIFCQALRRQATFLHLAQMVRPILYDCHMVNQIVLDVNNIQLETTHSCGGHCTQLEYDFLVQLKEVLHRQATVEAFTEWLDATVSRHIVKPCGDNKKLFKTKAQTFLLSWTRFGTELMQAMTSQNCASLTSFNLLKLLLDEYVMVGIESQLQDHADQTIMLEVSQLSLPPMGNGASTFYSKGSISLERSPSSLPSQVDDTTPQNTNSTSVMPTLSSSSPQSSCKYVHKEKTTPMDAGSQYWSFPSYYVAGPPAVWQSVRTEASASFTGYENGERNLSVYSQLHVDYSKEGYITPAGDNDTHLPPIGHVLY